MDMKQDLPIPKSDSNASSSLLNAKSSLGNATTLPSKQQEAKTLADSSPKQPYFILRHFRPLKQSPADNKAYGQRQQNVAGLQTSYPGDFTVTGDCVGLQGESLKETSRQKLFALTTNQFIKANDVKRNLKCVSCSIDINGSENNFYCFTCFESLPATNSPQKEELQGIARCQQPTQLTPMIKDSIAEVGTKDTTNDKADARAHDGPEKQKEKKITLNVLINDRLKARLKEGKPDHRPERTVLPKSLLNNGHDAKIQLKKEAGSDTKLKQGSSNESNLMQDATFSSTIEGNNINPLYREHSKASNSNGTLANNSMIAGLVSGEAFFTQNILHSVETGEKLAGKPQVAKLQQSDNRPRQTANGPNSQSTLTLANQSSKFSIKKSFTTLLNTQALKPNETESLSKKGDFNGWHPGPEKKVEENLSHSSNGTSEEKLCRAFSVERSLTITAKASSVHVSQSIEADPEVERSMRFEENRTLSFLNEDDEVVGNTSQAKKPAVARKNRLKLSSKKFNANKKFSICEERFQVHQLDLSLPQAPSFPNFTEPLFNYTKKDSLNKISTLDTYEHVKEQRYSHHIEANCFATHPTVSEADDSSLSCGDLNPQQQYQLFSPFSLCFEESDNRFRRDRAPLVSGKTPVNYFEKNFINLKPRQPEINFKTINVNTPSIDDEKKKKARAKKSQPIIDSHEFGIDIRKIYDVRKTTLMIKNIPNRYTKDMMLETIDKNFKDTYNFFYLPIDFDNNCNVGYAFINFIDLSPIEGFYKEFNGYTWPNFKSEKICAITYARIQGKEACVQHFKDSSLMKQEVS